LETIPPEGCFLHFIMEQCGKNNPPKFLINSQNILLNKIEEELNNITREFINESKQEFDDTDDEEVKIEKYKILHDLLLKKFDGEKIYSLYSTHKKIKKISTRSEEENENQNDSNT